MEQLPKAKQQFVSQMLDTELEPTTEQLELSHDTFSRNPRNHLRQVFEVLRELMTPPDPPMRPTEFVTPDEKKSKE